MRCWRAVATSIQATLSRLRLCFSADVGEVEGGKGEAWETTHVHVGGKSGGRADGVVVCALDVWELNISVCLLFFTEHGEHVDHGVVDVDDALDTAVRKRVVGAGGNFIDAEAVVDGEGKFGVKLESVLGKESDGASPERNVSVDKDVCRAGGGELSLCRGVHVGAAAETVC